MFAVAVVSALSILAATAYGAVIERQRVVKATVDINQLSAQIDRFRSRNFDYPATLQDVDPNAPLDPWGNAYHYTLLVGNKGKGSARKDHKLNPLNPDFDLFSAGKNGIYKTQISQKDSLDDVIRARGGAYIGLAEDY